MRCVYHASTEVIGIGEEGLRNVSDEFVNRSRLAAPLAMFLVLFSACDANKQIQMPKNGESDDRPNIIFLLADDQRGGTTSAENHPHIVTPNLDTLSQNAVVFSNAYSVQPICAPSRFAIFSGQYERTNGLGFNSPYSGDRSAVGEYLPRSLAKGRLSHPASSENSASNSIRFEEEHRINSITGAVTMAG